MKTPIAIPFLVLAMLTLALTGCSRGPSAAEVDQAVRAELEKTNSVMKQLGSMLFGEAGGTQVHEVKRLDCAEARDAAGYNCDVEIDMTAPLVGRSKSVASLRFVKTTDGWRVVERW
jgi:hypothetical protein